jgi:C1A family cysteine protease
VAQESPAPAPEPSALFQYYCERELDGDIDQDNGSTITQGINALKQYGICREAEWPYVPARFAEAPPQTAFDDALQFQALKVENIAQDASNGLPGFVQNLMDCLYNQRLPIVFGAALFQQFESEQCARDGIVTMPAANESPIGGHCQVIRGWKRTATGLLFQVQNSWGRWGDNGCDWMSDAYLAAHASDFWAVVTME